MNPQQSLGHQWSVVLSWCAAGCFLACAGGTAIQMLAEWRELTYPEVFHFGKHIVVLWLIAAFLIGRPTIGCLIAGTWGLVVPLEKYGMLTREVLAGLIGSGGWLAPMDELRLLLLAIGTYLSIIVALEFHMEKKKSHRSSATAKHRRSPPRTASSADWTSVFLVSQLPQTDLSNWNLDGSGMREAPEARSSSRSKNLRARER